MKKVRRIIFYPVLLAGATLAVIALVLIDTYEWGVGEDQEE